MLFYVLIQASIVVQNVFLKEDQENRQIFCQIDKKKKRKETLKMKWIKIDLSEEDITTDTTEIQSIISNDY